MKFRFLLSVVAASGFFTAPILQAQPDSTVHPIPVRAIPAPQPPTQTIAVSIDSVLNWDAQTKEVTVTNGTPQAHFSFWLTNVSSDVVKIDNVHTSCGCTAAKLPEQPWKLAPGGSGEIEVTMNLAGGLGMVTKTVTVSTDKGAKMLFVRSNILPPAAPAMGARETNQKLALTDRQAVFKGDCAQCHSEPAKGKTGFALYTAACGVCHEAEHRASMVPNLHAIAQETNAEFWKNWITHGKAGTLMPAFSEKEGGILSDAQIESLVTYLTEAIPSKPQIPAAKPTAKAL